MRTFLISIGLIAAFNSWAGSEGEVSAAQLLSVIQHGELIQETENQFQADTEKPKNISMYLVFTGPTGRITDPNDYTNHVKAVEIGVKRAKELIARYPKPRPAAESQKPPAGK